MTGRGLAVALALPVLILGGLALVRQQAVSAASEWRIPLTGADPRDLLRGNFIAFTYAWALEGDPARCTREACVLCLETVGGQVVARIEAEDSCRFRVDVTASRISVRRGPDGPQFGSRLFVSETSAPALEAELRRGPMTAVARLTEDGRLLVTRLEPAGGAAP